MENVQNILTKVERPGIAMIVRPVIDQPRITMNDTKKCNETLIKKCKEKDISCLLQFINEDFNNSLLFKDINNITLHNMFNIIFMIYLDNQHGKIEKLQNFRQNIEKSNEEKLRKNISEKELQEKKKNFNTLLEHAFKPGEYRFSSNKSKHLTREQVDDIIIRIKEEKKKRLDKNNINESPITYIKILNKFKKDALKDNKFIIWYCQWRKNINNLFNEAQQKIIPFWPKYIKAGPGSKNDENDNKFYSDELKILNDDYKNKTKQYNLGDKYNYILILGEMLNRLNIKNITKYNYLKKQKKFSVDEILDEYNSFNLAKILITPVGKFYDDYPSIFSYNDKNQNQNCMSQQLNKIFYYRYLINLKNLDQKVTLKDLLKGEQKFYLKNVLDLIVSNKVQQKLSNKLLSKITKKRKNILAWISTSPNYIITLGEQKNNVLYMKTIGHEVANGNKIHLTNHNENKINLYISTIPFFGGKKELNINCDNIIIKIRKNKEKSLTVRWNNKKFYTIIYQNNKYILWKLCGPDKDIKLAEYTKLVVNNKNKNLMDLLVYNVKPKEMMMIFAIGYALQYNIGRLFNNVSSTKTTVKREDCLDYK